MNNDYIKAKMLFALARKRKWGESHTAYENMIKNVQSEGSSKVIMKASSNLAEELFREGFIIKKPTHYGLQVSLNPSFSVHIKKMIKNHLNIEI